MLDCLIEQATNECEIVVSDNASTDDTEQVSLSTRAASKDCVMPSRTRIKASIGTFDRAVEASGEHCWLLPDDDLLKPGAIVRVLQALQEDWALVAVRTCLKFCVRGLS